VKAVLLYQTGARRPDQGAHPLPPHEQRLDEFHRRGDLLGVGTWADPSEGSMAVFGTRHAAEEFVKDDPFVENGVVSSYEIKDWNEILLGG
jgi:uncharacterized protein